MSTHPFKPVGVWQGYISGTNVGVLYVRFYTVKTELRARAFFVDHQYGPTTVYARRAIDDPKSTFALSQFQSSAPFVPASGQLSLVFNESCMTAEGTWMTDLGTSGTCRLSYTVMTHVVLFFRTLPVKIKWALIRWTPPIYILFLLAISVASLFERVTLTTLNLILLLLPTPFLFSAQLAKLIAALREAKVSKIGPVEFQLPASPEVVAAANNPVAESYKALNKFLVPRTKFILSAIGQKGRIHEDEFKELAKAIGTPPDNIAQTLQALIQVGCVAVDASNVVITDFGREYIRLGMKFGAT